MGASAKMDSSKTNTTIAYRKDCAHRKKAVPKMKNGRTTPASRCRLVKRLRVWINCHRIARRIIVRTAAVFAKVITSGIRKENAFCPRIATNRVRAADPKIRATRNRRAVAMIAIRGIRTIAATNRSVPKIKAVVAIRVRKIGAVVAVRKTGAVVVATIAIRGIRTLAAMNRSVPKTKAAVAIEVVVVVIIRRTGAIVVAVIAIRGIPMLAATNRSVPKIKAVVAIEVVVVIARKTKAVVDIVRRTGAIVVTIVSVIETILIRVSIAVVRGLGDAAARSEIFMTEKSGKSQC